MKLFQHILLFLLTIPGWLFILMFFGFLYDSGPNPSANKLVFYWISYVPVSICCFILANILNKQGKIRLSKFFAWIPTTIAILFLLFIGYAVINGYVSYLRMPK